jgi:hypothetical protein
MDPYSPYLIERGLRGMVGKGARSEEVQRAMREHSCVYFGAVEGTAALLADRVKEARVVAYEDLGPEAVRRLVVEAFPTCTAATYTVRAAKGGAGRAAVGRGSPRPLSSPQPERFIISLPGVKSRRP